MAARDSTTASGKNGNAFTGVSHALCAIIGSGCLALPQSVAYLGWPGGLASLLVFCAACLVAAHVQASLYEAHGRQHGRYQDAVLSILGRRWRDAVVVCQMLNIACYDIAYTITAAFALREIASQLCNAPGCSWPHRTYPYTLGFGGLQLALSQLPNLAAVWWMSSMGAATSLAYCCIAVGLSLANTAGGGSGSVGGVSASPADKGFGVANALGTQLFAFSCSVILLEIEDTLRDPPKPQVTMRRVINISYATTFAVYLLLAVTGYLALGNSVPANILTAFDGPAGIVVLANLLVVLHMLTGYQTYAQPLFVAVEQHISYRWLGRQPPCPALPSAPSTRSTLAMAAFSGSSTAAFSGGPTALSASRHQQQQQQSDAEAGRCCSTGGGSLQQLPTPFLMASEHTVRTISLKEEAEALHSMNMHQSPAPLWLRLLTRPVYVLLTTAVALVLPGFTPFLGLVGGLMFFPMAIAFPLAMWMRLHNPQGWTRRGLLAAAALLLCVSLAAVVGSTRNIILSWSTFSWS